MLLTGMPVTAFATSDVDEISISAAETDTTAETITPTTETEVAIETTNPALADETAVQPEAVTPLEAPNTLREALLTQVYVSSTGNDSNSGDSSPNAVLTLNRAIELVSDGGTIYVSGAVEVVSDITANKNVNLSYENGASINVNTGVQFAAGSGYTLTVKSGSEAITTGAIVANSGAIIGDGKYVFDYSSMTKVNQLASSAFKLVESSKIEGTNGIVDIEITNANLLATGTGTTSKIINANINQINDTKKYNVGGGAPYNLVDTTYKFTSSESSRLRFDNVVTMEGSKLIIDEARTTQYAVIFAGMPVPTINNSTIDIVKYGSILLDKGSANVTNSEINTDGIHTPIGGKPFKTVLFGTVDNTAVFTFIQDPEIGRVSFTDSNGNNYEYGLPVKHIDEVTKAIPLPKATLTFKSEDGSISKAITIIDGTSLEKLSGKVSADGVLIDKAVVDQLKSEIIAANGGKDIDFSMFIDGTTPYSFSDTINGDTTIVLKEASGVRYYLNDGSENNDKFVFVANNDDKTQPLTIDEIIAKDSAFKLRSKKFLGWYTDPEGTTPATTIDTTSKTNLYAKWEDKKAFNVTYHRNTPAGQTDLEPNTYTLTLYEGEHLAGIMVDVNENTHLITVDEAGNVLTGKGYYQSDFPRNIWYAWNSIGEYGWSNILFDNYKNLFRTQAWNTAADGSGTFYRGGHTLTAADFEATGGTIELYNQWIELEKLKKTDAAAIADPDRARPDIKLSGEDAPNPSDYETVADALVLDHSQTLNYYAYLNFEKLKTELVTLWGRINEVTEWHGTMNAYFDARLDFDKDIQILFESTWQVPDVDKLQEYGVTDVRQVEGKPTQWIFTIDKNQLMSNVITNRVGTDTAYDSTGYSYYAAKLPVKIIPKYDANGVDFQKLSYEDFMKPMTLTVYDNYGRGINSYVTKESANKIALSDKPVIIVGGDIQMNINGFERQGLTLLKYQLKSNAYDEHAKLYPSGEVSSSYELVKYDEYTNKLQDLTDPDNNTAGEYFEGRAKNEKITTDDPNNYAEEYSIKTPVYNSDTQKYELVAIRVQVQEVDENGNLKVDESGNPIITEKIYSDKFYTEENGKAGSLADGKALLSGSFVHDKRIKFVMQYAEPTIDIEVTKVWQGKDGNALTEAPADSVTVDLYIDGVKSDKTLVLKKSEEFKGKFEMLKPSKADGTAYEYTVKEVGLDNTDEIKIGETWYKATVTGSMTNGFTVTNKAKTPWTPMEPPTRDIKVTKVWQDKDGNALTTLPSSTVTVELFKDGVTTNLTRELSASNNWTGTFTGLKVSEELDGTDYVYTVKEAGAVSNGEIKVDGKWYVATVTGSMADGFTVTNKQKPETPVDPPIVPPVDPPIVPPYIPVTPPYVPVTPPVVPTVPIVPITPEVPTTPDVPTTPPVTNENPTTPDEDNNSGKSNNSDKSTNKTKTDETNGIPKTGDNNNAVYFVLFVSALAIALFISKKRKVNN